MDSIARYMHILSQYSINKQFFYRDWPVGEMKLKQAAIYILRP